MSLSRRQFIQASGIALCAGAIPLTANAAGQQPPLPIPRYWNPVAGNRYS
jgi:suppressor of ftsI